MDAEAYTDTDTRRRHRHMYRNRHAHTHTHTFMRAFPRVSEGGRKEEKKKRKKNPSTMAEWLFAEVSKFMSVGVPTKHCTTEFKKHLHMRAHIQIRLHAHATRKWTCKYVI